MHKGALRYLTDTFEQTGACIPISKPVMRIPQGKAMTDEAIYSPLQARFHDIVQPNSSLVLENPTLDMLSPLPGRGHECRGVPETPPVNWNRRWHVLRLVVDESPNRLQCIRLFDGEGQADDNLGENN